MREQSDRQEQLSLVGEAGGGVGRMENWLTSTRNQSLRARAGPAWRSPAMTFIMETGHALKVEKKRGVRTHAYAGQYDL